MKHNLVRRLLGVEVVALAPIVTDGIGKNVSRAVEPCRGDGTSHFGVSFQSVFGVLVPEMESSVAACCAKGAVDRVEANGVDGEDVADVAVVGRCLTMAFETEVVAGVFVVDVLDRAAAFYTAHCETCAVAEGADYAGLPLERRLDGFEEGGGVLEVDDVDPALCGSNDEHLVAADVH